jgi:hypothetical protein
MLIINVLSKLIRGDYEQGETMTTDEGIKFTILSLEPLSIEVVVNGRVKVYRAIETALANLS